jgi:hypothetical protein
VPAAARLTTTLTSTLTSTAGAAPTARSTAPAAWAPGSDRAATAPVGPAAPPLMSATAALFRAATRRGATRHAWRSRQCSGAAVAVRTPAARICRA